VIVFLYLVDSNKIVHSPTRFISNVVSRLNTQSKLTKFQKDFLVHYQQLVVQSITLKIEDPDRAGVVAQMEAEIPELKRLVSEFQEVTK